MRGVRGILGGTFDPIHYGHLELAREVAEAAHLCGVDLVPAGDPPHRAAPAATARQRLAMVELALPGYPGLRVDAREIRRAGRSYTVVTLEELRRERPDEAHALIIGADAFVELPTWHRWRELFALAHVIVVARPGTAFDGTLPPALAAEWQQRLAPSPEALTGSFAGTIVKMPITPHPISASAIRAALARGDPSAVRGLLPPAVLAYIERNRIYLPRPDAT
jgi:nicotinate-nucleotide adenylyltransferase